MRLGLLLATIVSFGQSYTVTDLGTLPGGSRNCGYGITKPGQVVARKAATLFALVFRRRSSRWWPRKKLRSFCRLPLNGPGRPSRGGRLFLESISDGFRQYVTLALAQGLSDRFVAIERIDFIQEQWRVNVLYYQDEIDQWVVSANADGTARYVWHRRLLEDKGAVLREELLPTDEDSTKAIVEKIVARFSSMLTV